MACPPTYVRLQWFQQNSIGIVVVVGRGVAADLFLGGLSRFVHRDGMASFVPQPFLEFRRPIHHQTARRDNDGFVGDGSSHGTLLMPIDAN